MSDAAFRTLVVDDDEAFGRVLVRLLGRRGHNLCFVTNVEDARAAVDAHEPDAVVLDLRLEEASGMDYLSELRAELPDTRIVILSGYASIAATVTAMQRGASDVLSKPTDIAALDGALRRHPTPPVVPAWEPLSPARAEWEYIQRVLNEHDGNISATARALGMHRRTLQRKLQKRAPR